MADVKVSGLPVDSSIDDNHYVIVNDPTGPTTRRMTLATVKAWLQSLTSFIKYTMMDFTTFPAQVTQEVVADQATTSTTYTDLATVGPAATVVVPASGKVLILWGAGIYNVAAQKMMGLALSGANTVAPDDNYSLRRDGGPFDVQSSKQKLFTGLTPGSTTFTCKYKTGSGTANFFGRYIIAIPIP